MILDTTSKVLKVILGEAQTTALEVNVSWADTQSGATFVPGHSSTVTNGVTAVTFVASPAASTQRSVKGIDIYNADNITHNIIVEMFDGTNTRRFIDQAVVAGGCLCYTDAGGWEVMPATSGGSGSVTSVGLVLPAIFTVSGSPVTSTGNLTAALATQAANIVWSGPVSGSAAAPSFRSLVAADLPLATTGAFGAVKPDGTTILISAGIISAPAKTEPTYQDFLTPGAITYTPSAGVTRAEVWMKAGGGGSANTTIGGTYNTGVVGGTTTFYSGVTCIGGGTPPANNPAAGGTGGSTGTGSPVGLRRKPGAPGGTFSMVPWSASTFGVYSGFGGGPGGGKAVLNVAAGIAGAANSGGGAGGSAFGAPDTQANLSNLQNYSNGAGEGEECWFTIVSPGVTTGTVGDGGAGGAASTGSAGAKGGSGFIRIKEYYD